MINHFTEGKNLRNKIKELVFDFMKNTPECSSNSEGLKQAVIFRECGLDWGEHLNATSPQQQFWVVALLRELEHEGKVKRDSVTKRWTVV